MASVTLRTFSRHGFAGTTNLPIPNLTLKFHFLPTPTRDCLTNYTVDLILNFQMN